MRIKPDANGKLMRAGRFIKRRYKACKDRYNKVKRFVTKRIVFFPALGGAVLIAILLALVVGGTSFVLAAVLTTVAAVVLTGHILRGRDPDLEVVIASKSRDPVDPSERVVKWIDPVEEKFEWQGREHLLSLLDIRPGLEWIGKALDSTWLWRLWLPGAISIAIMVVTFKLTHNIGIGLLVLLIIGLLLRIGEWHRRILFFTTERYCALRGLGTTRLLQVPYGLMTSFTIKIPWHSKLLKWLGIIKSRYGTLLITAPGEHNVEMSETPWMPDIESIARNLNNLQLAAKNAGKKKS